MEGVGGGEKSTSGAMVQAIFRCPAAVRQYSRDGGGGSGGQMPPPQHYRSSQSVLHQTRRCERPRRSRDHRASPIDVLYSFKARLRFRPSVPPSPRLLGSGSLPPQGTPICTPVDPCWHPWDPGERGGLYMSRRASLSTVCVKTYRNVYQHESS